MKDCVTSLKPTFNKSDDLQYIAYYRVSTKRQGISGLGLEAQRTAVQGFIGADDILVQEYREAESGKNNQRPQLMKAIKHCQHTKSTLLIAKLDRLSRNASFIFTLRDSQVPFKCVDMPEANPLTIGIMAVLAEDERNRISQRTKSALAELKRKGVKLGSPQNLTVKSREKSVEVRQQRAKLNEHNMRATALIISLRKEGKSFRQISDVLNSSGFLTRNGKLFVGMTVKRLYDRSTML